MKNTKLLNLNPDVDSIFHNDELSSAKDDNPVVIDQTQHVVTPGLHSTIVNTRKTTRTLLTEEERKKRRILANRRSAKLGREKQKNALMNLSSKVAALSDENRSATQLNWQLRAHVQGLREQLHMALNWMGPAPSPAAPAVDRVGCQQQLLQPYHPPGGETSECRNPPTELLKGATQPNPPQPVMGDALDKEQGFPPLNMSPAVDHTACQQQQLFQPYRLSLGGETPEHQKLPTELLKGATQPNPRQSVMEDTLDKKPDFAQLKLWWHT